MPFVLLAALLAVGIATPAAAASPVSPADSVVADGERPPAPAPRRPAAHAPT